MRSWGSDFRKPMTCEYIGKQRSSGENAGIVTGGLEIELTGASAVLHDVAVERQPPPHLPNRSPYFGSWRDQVTRLPSSSLTRWDIQTFVPLWMMILKAGNLYEILDIWAGHVAWMGKMRSMLHNFSWVEVYLILNSRREYEWIHLAHNWF